MTPRTRLSELALLFGRLGATSFGGPAAHVALMEDEVVRRRGWVTSAGFLDLVGATNLIPGPNSTELAIHLGYARRGWAGLVVAGVAFIVPALVATAALAWAYVEWGATPTAGWLLRGVKPVILGVVLQAIAGLAPKAASTWLLRAVGVGAAAAVVAGVDELAVLFGAGAVVLGARGAGLRAMLPVVPLAAASAMPAVTLPGIFWVFCKIGSVLFGSGYVLLAFLQSELVDRLGWLTQAQLLEAIAAGQVTPGPVFSSATFVGWILAGPWGALVATVGIFLPAFVFVALSAPLVPRLRASPSAGAFLDGVNVASLALMAVVTLELGRAAILDGPTLAIALVSTVLLVKWRVNSTWLIAGGALAGWVVGGVS